MGRPRKKHKTLRDYQTSLRLNEDERKAVAAIQDWVERQSGIEVGEAQAIRLAIREFAAGLE
jgi:hypothetical protein